jgi:putative ABC transport system substrate-binding protein
MDYRILALAQSAGTQFCRLGSNRRQVAYRCQEIVRKGFVKRCVLRLWAGSGVALVLGLALVVAPNLSSAQQSPKVPHIGVLAPQRSSESPSVQRIPFEQGLRDLGWTPGKDVIIEYRYAEGDLRKLAQLAAELVALHVDVIVARSPPAIRAAQKATVTIPIVMAASTDPVREGFVKSLGRPSGNITGLAIFVDDLGAKQLEWLKAAVPKLQRVAILVNPTMNVDQDTPFLANLNATARALNIEVAVIEASRPEDIPTAFADLQRQRADALLVRADPLVLEPHAADIVALTAAQHLPAIYPWRLYVDAGGLMSYATGLSAFHRRSATYVDRILKGGVRPENLPVEQPLTYELVINLKTAKALGLVVPSLLLLQADEVIR